MPTTKTATDRELNLGPALGYDENFGQLDLSGCPSVRPLPKNTSWIDERLAPLDDRGKSSGLKEFIEEQTAEKEKPSVVHVAGQPFKVHISDGIWRGEGVLNGQRRRLTAPDKDRLMAKFVDLAKQNAIRELTRTEELEIARDCQSGDRQTAISKYLRYALGARAARYEDGQDILSDVELIPLMDACAEFVWFNSTPQASDSPEWQAYKLTFIGSRPTTCELLDSAWQAFEKHNRYGLLTPEKKSEEPANPRKVLAELNELDDNAVNKLMVATAREYAREVRAGVR